MLDETEKYNHALNVDTLGENRLLHEQEFTVVLCCGAAQVGSAFSTIRVMLAVDVCSINLLPKSRSKQSLRQESSQRCCCESIKIVRFHDRHEFGLSSYLSPACLLRRTCGSAQVHLRKVLTVQYLSYCTGVKLSWTAALSNPGQTIRKC